MNLLSKHGREMFFHGEKYDVLEPVKAPWKNYSLSEKMKSIHLGPLKIWFQVKGDDLWLTHWRGANPEEKAPELPEDDEWTRWGLNRKYEELAFRPALSHNPVLLIPETPLIVAPKVQIKVYARTPIWAQCYLKRGKTYSLIKELPSVELTKTWFGTPTHGEICWGKKTSVPRVVDLSIPGDHLCISPILIRNSSDEDLNIDRICHRTRLLSVYSSSGKYWSEATRIQYKSKIKGSEIRVQSEAPREIGNDHQLLANAREPAGNSLMGRAFTQWRNATHLG